MDYDKTENIELGGKNLTYHFDYTQEGPIFDGADGGYLNCSDNCEDLLFSFYLDRKENGDQVENLKTRKVRILTLKSVVVRVGYKNQDGFNQKYRDEKTIIRTLASIYKYYKQKFGENFDFEKIKEKKSMGVCLND